MGYQNDEEALDKELDELTGLLRDNIQAKILNLKLSKINKDIRAKIEHCKTYS